MGFFSWKCAVSGESVANMQRGKPKEQSECLLVTPTEVLHESTYEGNGVFGGKDVYELLGEGDREKGIDLHFNGEAPFGIKVVLKKHYSGQTYDELPNSEECEYQGYFF